MTRSAVSEKAEGSGPRLFLWRDAAGDVQAAWFAHSALAPADAVDCTDMNDDEFEREVTR
jgi:hypothetical protein